MQVHGNERERSVSEGSTLQVYGWEAFFEKSFHPVAGPGRLPARVIGERKGMYRLVSEKGELCAGLSGRLRHEASGTEGLPTAGDWVVIDSSAGTARIESVLPRKSCFQRKSPGSGPANVQNLAANVDTVFLMMSLNLNFNLRRLERFLSAAWASGAEPAVLLSKADLVAEPGTLLGKVEALCPGVTVTPVSSWTGLGLDQVRSFIRPGRTVALLGSSGVGKSTLVNTLHGRPLLNTSEVREWDDRGRHATTSRDLILLPAGGLLLDTPGLRELGLWDAEEGVSRVFQEIEDLGLSCRYRDCSHGPEPGCAVQEALAEGRIDPERLGSYRKLQRELEYSVRRSDAREEREQKLRWKKIHKAHRQMSRLGPRKGWRG